MAADANWMRVRALFEAAVALEPAARSALLDDLAPADRALRDRVEQMLAADAGGDDFLEPPAARSEPPSLVGRRIGSYVVVGHLASGGMGSVWEAEQVDPRRKVAIKTMHAGLTSERFRRRFRFEAELLAGLRHPAIAQVYASGVLDGGNGVPSMPWFALEFVEGARALCRFADDERLDLAARLRLFQTVCGAVQHAHQRGVIHRDLKAANVLVDGGGHVKVIDFGIARLVDGDDAGETMAGEVLGTLESMSPEQVEGLRDQIDARTDVYALGAVLYELVTGQRPHRLEGLSLAEAARRIREVEPPAPTRIAAGLPREIDWIAAKAMAKEPARRYAAASDLAAEIDRLLAGQAVEACPPSRTYHLRKFCRRHRTTVAVVAIGVLALIAGAAGLAFGQASRQDARVAAAATRAETDVKDRFAKFLIGLFEDLAAERADGQAPTREALLERGTEWLRRELADRPLEQAGLLCSVGGVRSGYGDFAGAGRLLQDAVALARTAGTAGENVLADSLVQLSRVYRQQNSPVPAERALREALAIQQRRLGTDAVELGPILSDLGILAAPSRPDDAIELQRRAYDIEVRHHGRDSGNAAILLGNLGMIEFRQRRFEAARATFEQALPIIVERHGASDPRVATLYGNLAATYQSLGDLDRALDMQLRELAITERVTPDHPQIGISLIGVAQLSEAVGEPRRALEHIERAIAILAKALRPDHVQRLAAENTRARLWLRAGNFERARTELERIAALQPEARDGRLAQHASNVVLADLERLEGNHPRALELIDSVIGDALTANDVTLTAQALWVRAFVFAQMNDPQRAQRERERALAMVSGSPQPYAEAKLAVLSGDPERAVAVFRNAVAGGYRNATVLSDAEFAVIRQRGDFAPIAAAIERRGGEPAERR